MANFIAMLKPASNTSIMILIYCDQDCGSTASNGKSAMSDNGAQKSGSLGSNARFLRSRVAIIPL